MTQAPPAAPDQLDAFAQRMQSFALLLFDCAASDRHLEPALRPLLHLAAACYAAACQAGSSRPDRDGRELALALPADLTPEQRCLVASVVAFQREKLRRHREVVFLRLTSADQQAALRLAALLQLAVTLAEQAVDDLLVRTTNGHTTLIVRAAQGAPPPGEFAQRAQRWQKLFGPISIRPATPEDMFDEQPQRADPGGLIPLVLPPAEGLASLSGSEPIAEGARRMLRRSFEKLIAREDGARSGDDPEDVHQMRVATRRLRASLQIVAPIYDPKLVRRFRRGLKRLAAALGAVRDSDVFLAHVTAYYDQLPAERQAQLAPLVAAITSEREQARAALLAELDSNAYAKLKHTFAEFATTPGAGVDTRHAGPPERVRDRAGSMIWRRYEELRAFETLVPGADDATLHEARIAGKRLRYTIEFFADALGERAGQVLDPLVDLQDTLGALQDAVVAHEHVRRLGLADDPGAQAYLASRAAEHAASKADVPRAWTRVTSATYRRRLFELIIKM